MKNLVSLLAAIIVCLSGCGGSGGDGDQELSSSSGRSCDAIGLKVANGETCQAGSSPQSSPIVRLTFQDSFGQAEGLCTGTLVDPFTVLTAAHCFETPPSSLLVESFVDYSYATSYAVHPSFSASDESSGAVLFNDIALVYLENPLSVSPAPILFSRSAQVGEEAVVAGFGEVTNGDGGGSIHAGNAIIREVTPNHIFITFNESESHPCRGDSGGPLLVSEGGTWSIVGVVSQSDPSVAEDNICSPGDVTLYTNVQGGEVSSFLASYAPSAATKLAVPLVE